MKALPMRVRGPGAEPGARPGRDPDRGALPIRGRRYAQAVRGRRTRSRPGGREPHPRHLPGGAAFGVRSRRWSGTQGAGAVRTVGAALIDDFTGRSVVRGRGRRLLWQLMRIFAQVCR